LYAFLSFVEKQRNNSSYARARKVAAIKSFFKYLNSKTKIILENPASDLETPKINKRNPVYLTLKESKDLLNSVDETYKHHKRDLCIITLFLNCGLRLSELCSINISRIKEDTLTIIGKGNKERTVYLNKTCYNGLFRVNKAGEFNTPFGYYKNPNIVNEVTLRAVSKYFNQANITFLNGDFEETLKGIRKGSFVYFDPPYDPLSNSANFTGYDKGGFNREEQKRLKCLCDKLNNKGIKFLLSNSATNFTKDLYKDYNIEIIQAKRAVNSKADLRGEVDEVLVRNYE
jgi:hypothetical protein